MHTTPVQAAMLLTLSTGVRWAVWAGQLCCRWGQSWAPVPYTPGAELDTLASMAGRYTMAGFNSNRE